MSKLIDNIFDPETIRYVPTYFQKEWKNLYNLYVSNYFNKQDKIYNINCVNRNDNRNDEYLKLTLMNKYCDDLKNYIDNLQPKYNTDVEYAKRIKNKLLKSIKKINRFVNNKLTLVNIKKNSIENNIEQFENTQTQKNKSYKNTKIICIFLIMIFLLL